MPMLTKNDLNEVTFCMQEAGFNSVQLCKGIHDYHDSKCDYEDKGHEDRVNKLAMELKGFVSVEKGFFEIECRQFIVNLNHSTVKGKVMVHVSR